MVSSEPEEFSFMSVYGQRAQVPDSIIIDGRYILSSLVFVVFKSLFHFVCFAMKVVLDFASSAGARMIHLLDVMLLLR